MADKKYEQSTSNTITAIGTFIKGKMPIVDPTVSQSSGNAVSAAAVYSFVSEKIAETRGISFKIENTLPATGEPNYIYLIPKSSAEADNIYDEYIWYGGKWEHIGSTAVDLSGYVKSSELHEITADEVNTILGAVWG